MDGQTLGDRTREIGGRLYIGEVIFAEEHAHLKLLKVRDREAWMGIYDAKAKRLEDIVQGDTSQLYETSIVSFLDFGNIIGIIQGSTSAPTATAVCEWIEELGVLGKGNQLATQAVLSKQAREDLTRSSEATRIETTVSTTKAQALEARGSKLSGILRSVTEQFGPSQACFPAVAGGRDILHINDDARVAFEVRPDTTVAELHSVLGSSVVTALLMKDAVDGLASVSTLLHGCGIDNGPVHFSVRAHRVGTCGLGDGVQFRIKATVPLGHCA